MKLLSIILLSLWANCLSSLYGQLPCDTLTNNKEWAAILKCNDTPEKADLLYKAGYAYSSINLDTALIIYNHLSDLCTRIGDKERFLKAANIKCWILNQQGKIEESITLSLESIEIAKEIRDTAKLGNFYNSIAMSYAYTGKFDSAILHGNYAKDLYIATQNDKKLGYTYSILAFIYNNMLSDIKDSEHIYHKIVEYRKKAIDIDKSYKDTTGLLDNFIGLGIIYNNWQEQDSALYFLKKARKLAELTNNKRSLVRVLTNLSNIYSKQGEHQKGLNTINDALSIAERVSDKMAMIFLLDEKSKILHNMERYEEALDVQKALIPMMEEKQLEGTLEQVYYKHAFTLNKLNNYKEAYDFLLKAVNHEDSIKGADLQSKVSELEIKYDVALNEKKIAELTLKESKSQYLISLLIGAIILMTLIGLFLFYRLRLKHLIHDKNEIISFQNAQVKASEQIIKGQETERKRIAQELHDGLGGILTGLKFTFTNMESNYIVKSEQVKSFQKAIEQIDFAIEEMRKIAHNMMPEALSNLGLQESIEDIVSSVEKQSDIKFIADIHIDENIPDDVSLQCYRIIQEAINNIIKHADASTVFLSIYTEEQGINISIEDNGKGFDPNQTTEGMGVQGMHNRVSFLGGTMDISARPREGVSIAIRIPYKNETL